jgi:hypothetical protein
MFPPSLDKLYPWVVPGSYIDLSDSDMLLNRPFSEDVHLALAFDGNGIVRNAGRDELAAFGLDEDAAFMKACENLAWSLKAEEVAVGVIELDDGIEIGVARNSWKAPAAALVIGEIYNHLSTELDAKELVGIAVNQQTFLAFSPDEWTLASPSLRKFVDEEFNARKPISRSWLLFDGNWPRAWPGLTAF